MPSDRRVSGSFRDPSGFLFYRDGILYRQINQVYREHYDFLMQSGIYDRLVADGSLIPHQEVSAPDRSLSEEAYRLITPQVIRFLTYPYEWCFSQLKDAALVTLAIQKTALDKGMTLKDASAYNIQFVNGKPVLIDTLSFEIYREGAPWVAYRQFCQHFLAPLALMSYTDVRLSQLLRIYIDGVPLDLAAQLLPLKSRFQMGILLHIHLHAAGQRHRIGEKVDVKSPQRQMSKQAMLGLIDSLEQTVRQLQWGKSSSTAWADYYADDSYTEQALVSKQEIVTAFLDEAAPSTAVDLGANTGLFSRIASQKGILTLSADSDNGAVELNYRQMTREGNSSLLPMLVDLTNPNPALGWANREREAFQERAQVDLVLALALIHHLAISNNVPLEEVAQFFAGLAEWLIVEFVPKSDPKVKILLAAREDIFNNYTQAGFEKAFSQCYKTVRSEPIQGSERRLYLLKRL